MNGIMIHVMLLRQCVESNPGPVLGSVQKSNMSVRTYNCNGLGVIDKFRRILIKIRREVGSGGIVLLQETHNTCLLIKIQIHFVSAIRFSLCFIVLHKCRIS